jgi:uncharacterized membrane protein
MRKNMERIVDKLHIRSGVLVVGAILVLLGVYLILSGIKDDGFIDLNSAFISGQVKSGLVGVTFAFLGFFLCALVVLIKPTTHKIKVQVGKTLIEWDGVTSLPRNMEIQKEMIEKLAAEDAANKSIQPTADAAAD